jgi:hypothetical protein
MKLPHLDQIVLLERGEAGLLARALHVLVQDVASGKRPQTPASLFAFAPTEALARRLDQMHQREQLNPRRPGRYPKPRPLRVPYDQLLSLLHHRSALYYCGLSEEEKLLLPGLVGKFQNKALNLTNSIRF